MTNQLYILTGASRGLGLAMAQQLISPGHRLLCISRHTNPHLTDAARQSGVALTQWQADLSQPQAAAEQLQQWLQAQADPAPASVTLINNAALLSALTPLRAAQPQDLAQALRVGLEAPLLLCAAFLAATQTWPARRRVLNISSGLGRRAMASAAAYCAAKAGMDHFTRCLALDEAQRANGARVCSLAPGVIDTDMQLQLRSANASDFPDQPGFAHLQQAGQLTSAADAASRVLAYLQRADFGTEPVADVRH